MQKRYANIWIIIAVIVLSGIAGYFVFVDEPTTQIETEESMTTSGAVDSTITPTPTSDISPEDDTSSNGTKTEVKIPQFPTTLDTGSPAPPADQALAEITVLAQTGEGWTIRINKIRDYIRYPDNTNPELKLNDAIFFRLTGWVDIFEMDDGPPLPPSGVRSQPEIAVGEEYLSKLFGCFLEIPCSTIGWSGWLYVEP